VPKEIIPQVLPRHREDALTPKSSIAHRRCRSARALARLRLRTPRWLSVRLAGIIGLIPGIGDVVDAIVSLFIIGRAIHSAIPRIAIARMLVNVAIEAIAGTVPLIGDLFDVAFKANRRNYQLLKFISPIQAAPNSKIGSSSSPLSPSSRRNRSTHHRLSRTRQILLFEIIR